MAEHDFEVRVTRVVDTTYVVTAPDHKTAEAMARSAEENYAPNIRFSERKEIWTIESEGVT